MKKSKILFMTMAIIGALVSFLIIFQFLKDHFDGYKEEDLFDEDTDLDFIDENITEEPMAPAAEDKTDKAAQKVRRGYTPIKLHTSEAAD